MLLWAWEGVYRSALKRAMSLASTNPHQMVRAETAISPVELLQSSCGSDTQWCDSMQVSQAGCRCDELYFETKFCDCDMLLWSWEGVYRSVLKRAMSLASTNPHRWCVQRQRSAQWHCCSQAVEVIHNGVT